MTSDPSKLVDSEGEEMSLNRVDKALKSIGISMQTATGEFRDFDEVILELAEKWETLDKNSQRYIATIMAGNRQQSRFLALVGNYDEYAKALEIAANAEETGTLQTLKTLDSIQTKLQQAKTAWEEFYNAMKFEQGAKTVLGGFATIFTNLSNMNLFSGLTTIANLFVGIYTAIKGIFAIAKTGLRAISGNPSGRISELMAIRTQLENPINLKADTSQVMSSLNQVEQKINQLSNNNIRMNASVQTPQAVTGANMIVLNSTKRGKHVFSADANAAITAIINASDPKHRTGAGSISPYSRHIEGGRLVGYEGIVGSALFGSGFQRTDEQMQRVNNTLAEVNSNISSSSRLVTSLREQEALVIQRTQEQLQKTIATVSYFGTALTVTGAAIQTIALSLETESTDTREKNKLLSGIGSTVSGAGVGLSIGAMLFNVHPVLGIIVGIITALPSLISGLLNFLDGWDFSLEERLETATKQAQESKNTAVAKKGEYTSLQKTINELKSLEEAQYNSLDDMQAYKDKLVEISEEYPELVSVLGESEDAIFAAQNAEILLTNARLQSAQAAESAAKDEYERRKIALQTIIAETPSASLASPSERKILRISSEETASLYESITDDTFETASARDLKVVEALAAVSLVNEDDVYNILASRPLSNNYSAIAFMKEMDYEVTPQLQITTLSGTGEDASAILQKKTLAYGDSDGTTDRAILSYYFKQQPNQEYWENMNVPFDLPNKPTFLGKTVDEWKDYPEELAGIILSNEQYKGFYEKAGYKQKLNEIGMGIGSGRDLFVQFFGWLQSNNIKREAAELALVSGTNDYTTTNAQEDLLTQSNTYFNDLEKQEFIKGNLSHLSGLVYSTYAADYRYKPDIIPEGEDTGVNAAYYVSLAQVKNMLKNLEVSQLEKFIQFTDSLKYINSSSDISEFSKDFEDDDEEIVETLLTNYYNQLIKPYQQQLKGFFASKEGKNSSAGEFKSFFDGENDDDLAYVYTNNVIATINQIDDLTNKGLLTRAKNLRDNASGLYSEIKGFSTEQNEDLFPVLSSLDLTSAESINDTITALKTYQEEKGVNGEIAGIIAHLITVKDNLIGNVIVEIETWADTIENTSESRQKAIAGLTEGMDFDEANEKFSTWGKDGEEFGKFFEYKDGKWKYTQKGYSEEIAKTQKKLNDAKESANKSWQKFTEASLILDTKPKKYTNDWVQSLYEEHEADQTKKQVNDWVQSLYEEYKADQTKTEKNFKDYFNNRKAEAEELYLTVNSQYEAFTRERGYDFAKGVDLNEYYINPQKYESLINTAAADLQDINDDTITQAINGNLEALQKVLGVEFTEEAIESANRNKNQSYASAIQEILSENWTTLENASDSTISVLKGLNLAEYDDNGRLKLIESKNNAQIAEIIREELGPNYSIAEYNSALVGYYENLNKDTTKSIHQFFSDAEDGIDYSEIGNLATTLDKSINDFLDEKGKFSIQKFKEILAQKELDGNYDAYLTELSNTLTANAVSILDDIFEGGEKIAQSQVYTLEQIAETYRLIGNEAQAQAIESMVTNLSNQQNNVPLTAEQYYTNLKTITNETEEGLSLAAERAKETNEELGNVLYVEKEIARIEKEIADLKSGDKRKEVLESELEIAKEIHKELLEAGNAFNFMERPIPTDETNPISAWEGMAQFLEVINGEAFAAGKMLYSDFNAIANLLDEGNITLMNAAGDSIQAIELLAQGQESLVIEDGQVFVGLEQLGEHFNISGEQYAEAVEKAVKKIAEAEIKRLRAQKLLLEGISFTSKTNKLAQEALEDGKIETDDIIQQNEDGTKKYTKSAEQIFNAFVKLAEYAGFDLGAGFHNIAELFSNLSEESFINTFSFIGDILLLAQTDIDAAIEKLKSSTEELKKIKEEVDISQGILPPETGSKQAGGAAEDDAGGTITNPPEIEVPATVKVKPQQIILVDETGNAIEVITLDGFYLAIANIGALEGKIGEGTNTEPVSTGAITFTKNDLDSWILTGDLNTLTALYNGAKITKETEGLEGIEKIEIPLTDENVLNAIGILNAIIGSYEEGKTGSEVSGAVTVNDIPLIDGSVLVALGILNTVKARYDEVNTEGVVNEKVVLEGLDLTSDSILDAVGILKQITGSQDDSTVIETTKATAENIPLTADSSLTALGYLNKLVANYLEGTTSKETREADNQEFAITGSHAEGDLVSATATYVPGQTTDDISGLEGKEFDLGKTLSAEGEVSKANVTLTPKTEIIPSGNKKFEINGNDFIFKITKSNESGEIEELTISIPVEPDTGNLDGLTNRIKETLIAQGFSIDQAGNAASELVLAATVQVGDNYTPSEELDEIASLISSEDNIVNIKVEEEGSTDVQTAVNDLIEGNKGKTIYINFEIGGSGITADRIFGEPLPSNLQEQELRKALSNYIEYTDMSSIPVKRMIAFDKIDEDTDIFDEQLDREGHGASVPVYNADYIEKNLKQAHTKLTYGYRLLETDIQYINQLNTYLQANPNQRSFFAWADELESVMTLLDTPLNADSENGLVESITRLGEVQVENIVQAIVDLTQNSTVLSTLSFDQFKSFLSSLNTTLGSGGTAAAGLNTIKSTLETLSAEGYEIKLIYKLENGTETEGRYNLEINDEGTINTLMSLATALINLNTQAGVLVQTSNAITENGPKQVSALREAMDGINSKAAEVNSTADAINRLTSKTVEATVKVSVDVSGSQATTPSTSTSVTLTSSAKGNYAYAKGTLMGELGPELIVSNGRYYTVGNNGAEFVDLPSDAIVFNHLQTKKLLNNGSISSTGTPKESEKKSVAMATGNVTGPARAKSVDDEIKEIDDLLRLWQGLAGYDAKSLSQKAAGGAGGKGGEIDHGFLGDLERWYNLLRQIAKVEQQINYLQAERETLTRGYDHVDSIERELLLLKKQEKNYSKLAELQKSYYDQRREDLLKTDYSKIFTYDEDGLMQYVDGKGYGLDILATLNATDEFGVAKMTAEEQVQYLKNNGFDINQFMTKADGTKIKSNEYASIIEQFWSGIDGWMGELDGLYDEYNEHATNAAESLAEQNELLQEYIDNQRAVEDKLLQAIEDREQAEIDKLQENLDALSNAASQYIEGLNDALQKEREMYSQNEEDTETVRLQRQLAILQRSGGSASEIRSLQDQLDSRLQESYFSEQERQIQAVQDASDAQLEKLQQQLDVMNETLEYQKENGLLWHEVSEMMMNWTPEAMLAFIEKYTASYKSDSTLAKEEASKETLKEIEIYDAKKDADERNALWETYFSGAKTRYDESTIDQGDLAANQAYIDTLKAGKTQEEAASAADAVFQGIIDENKQRELDAQAQADALQNAQANTDSSSGKKTTAKKQWQFTWGSSVKKGFGSKEAAEKAIQDLAKVEENTLVSAYQDAGLEKETALAYARRSVGAQASFARQSIKQYKTGGLVDFTGPAWVDGTKAKPEAFLSAEDTALLKSKIFSNSDYSLKSAIEAIEALGRQFTSIDNSSIQEGVTFENVTVQIQSGVISSDYDARRAGEQVLEELMSIARRNSNIGVARR